MQSKLCSTVNNSQMITNFKMLLVPLIDITFGKLIMQKYPNPKCLQIRSIQIENWFP